MDNGDANEMGIDSERRNNNVMIKTRTARRGVGEAEERGWKGKLQLESMVAACMWPCDWPGLLTCACCSLPAAAAAGSAHRPHRPQ